MKICRKLLVVLLSMALLLGIAASGVSALTGGKHWAGSWSAGMTNISITLLEGKENTEGLKISPVVRNMTARIRLTPTLGGNKVRFCLSNENGMSPLVINEASIARAKGDSGSEIVEGSSIPVTFNGSRKVSVPAGGTVYCDPIDMEVRALEDLCVTYYAQDFSKVQTMGLYGGTTYLTFGNHTEDVKLTGIKLSFGTLVSVVPLLSSLDVYADADAYSIVVIGDSTTSNDIPKLLAKRIIEETGENKVGVLQKSIDIFAEMSPWKGYTRDLLKTGRADLEWTPEAQEMCDQLTQWIRTTDQADGSINLDCLKDPADPAKMPDNYTSDGAHLLPPAQEAFVDSIDLSLFGIGVPEHPASTDAAEGLEPTQAQTTQPDTAGEATLTQAETKAADSTMEAEETQAEMPEIAGTGDSLVAGGAALAALAACGLLIVTRKKQ